MTAPIDIVYEDNHLLIVNKTAGVLVQEDEHSKDSMENRVKVYLQETYNKAGAAFLGVVHRIDRPVSGLVLFAKTSKALVRLNEMMKKREIKKHYWAIVKNIPEKPEGSIVCYLKRDAKKNKSYCSKEEVKDSKLAILHYRLLRKSDNYALLEIELETGRHHQIRAQLAYIGCPIKGDLKYGFPRSNKDGSICLHSRGLRFLHPVKQTEIQVIAKCPEDALWQALSSDF